MGPLFVVMFWQGLLIYSNLRFVQGTNGTLADIVFVVDSSGSIRDRNPADYSYDNWNKILEFVADVIDGLNIADDGDHVGLVIYSQVARLEFTLNFSYNKMVLRTAVLNSAYMGSLTNTSGGIRAMHMAQFDTLHGARSSDDVAKIAIVITDGETNVDADRTIRDAERAKDSGIDVIVVGVTDDVDIGEVRDISSQPQILNQNYYLIYDLMTLSDSVSEIVANSNYRIEI